MANMERVASLFLVKTVYSALISLGVVLTQIPFPYLPRHITYIGALTIGMPAFILALAPNTRRYIPGFLRRVVHFALPGASPRLCRFSPIRGCCRSSWAGTHSIPPRSWACFVASTRLSC